MGCQNNPALNEATLDQRIRIYSRNLRQNDKFTGNNEMNIFHINLGLRRLIVENQQH